MQEDSSTTGTTTTTIKNYLMRLVFPSLTRARVKSHVSGKNERRVTFASGASILGASSIARGRALSPAAALAPTIGPETSKEKDSSPPTPSASSASLANKSSSISAVFSSGPNKGNAGFHQT